MSCKHEHCSADVDDNDVVFITCNDCEAQLCFMALSAYRAILRRESLREQIEKMSGWFGARQLKVSPQAVHRELREFVDAGMLEKRHAEGSAKQVYYKRVS